MRDVMQRSFVLRRVRRAPLGTRMISAYACMTATCWPQGVFQHHTPMRAPKGAQYKYLCMNVNKFRAWMWTERACVHSVNAWNVLGMMCLGAYIYISHMCECAEISKNGSNVLRYLQMVRLCWYFQNWHEYFLRCINEWTVFEKRAECMYASQVNIGTYVHVKIYIMTKLTQKKLNKLVN